MSFWDSFFTSVKENVSFLAVCLAIFAGLVLLAVLLEKIAARREAKASQAGALTSQTGAGTQPGAGASSAGRPVSPLRKMTVTALLSALGAVLMLLDIPLFFAPGFYKLDLSEFPVLICGFALGPVSGVACEFLKVLLKLLMKGTTTAFVGDFSSFVIGCAMVLPAAALYRFKKTKKRAWLALIVGTLVMTVFGSLLNAWYLIPQYARLFGMPLEAIVAAGTAVNSHITDVRTLVLFAVVPFNLLKGILLSALSLALYKYLKKILIGK